jgi:hypothetical protein
LALAKEAASLDGVFLEDNAGEPVLPGTMIPQHVHDAFPAVIVMEKRRIEAAAVERRWRGRG